MEDRYTFGQWLKHRRQAEGLTQHDLAQRVGYSFSAIRKLEADEMRPSHAAAVKLTEVLHIAAADQARFISFARDEPGVDDLPIPTPTPSLREPALRQSAPSNIPIPLTPLIGREADVRAVQDLLLRQDVRLVTLTGPGGIGKTRLAMQVGTELAEQFEDGVFFVDLAPIHDPDRLPFAIAHALGVREQAWSTLVDTLKEYLLGRRLLLLLDNFEQIVAAGPLITELLAAAPALRAVVTSRAVLHLSGEHDFAVPPLALPSLTPLPPFDQLSGYESVRLFVQRARAANHDFVLTPQAASVVAQICHRLDGLPLAIELAAGRSRALPPQALLERLSKPLRLLRGGAQDVPARQQTVEATIAWSYSLLSDSEQVLFRQLGVFSGGFSLEGAEAVCGGDGVSEVLAGVVSLVDKSLVKTQELGGRVRFGMLETVREYAVERLEESGEARLLGQKHLAFFLALAETAEPEFLGPEQGEWFDRVEADLANVYRALDWGIAAGGVEQGLRLASSLRDFWLSRNHYREGQAWLERLLKLSGSQESLNRAKAVSTAALIAQWTGDWVTAHRLGEEGITLWRMLDDKRGLAEALNVVGMATWLLGDYTTCLPMFEEALQLCRDIGDSAHLDWALSGFSVALVIHGRFADATDLMAEALTLARSRGDQSMTAYCLSHTGHIHLQQSHYAEARALYQASAALCRELGDSWPLANNLLLLGYTSWAEGDYEDATALCQESLALWRGLGHKQRGANTLNVLGLIARALDKPTEADALYRESLDLFQVTSHRLGEAALRHNLGRLAEQHGELARAATLYRESLRLNHAQRDWRATAFCLAGLGRVADRLGDPQRAGRLFGASDGLLAAGGPLLIPDDRVEYDHDSPAAPKDTGVERAWAEDRALTLEQAVAYALEAAPIVEQYRGG